MPPVRTHRYQITNRWTGNLGAGTASYRAYSRDHELTGSEKAGVIQGSSDPQFRGNRERYSPEELLVGALASCHMLWVLHLCAEAGIVIEEYTDDAIGEMVEHGDGSGEFTHVWLHPRMAITDPARTEDAIAIHGRAHSLCFIARSVNFPVDHEPAVVTVAPQEKA